MHKPARNVAQIIITPSLVLKQIKLSLYLNDWKLLLRNALLERNCPATFMNVLKKIQSKNVVY